jgi:hypothetical protein
MRLDRLGFAKGIAPSHDPSTIAEQGLWEGHNVRIDESGILRIRRGHDTFGESLGAGPVQGMVSAFGDIVLAAAGNLYRVNDQGAVTAITGGTVATDPTGTVEFIRWTRNAAEIVYAFGSAGIYSTDGATVSLLTPKAPLEGQAANVLRANDGTQNRTTGPARCTRPVLRASVGQRLAAAGDPTSPNRVYMSAPLDPTYWPENEIIQLPDDGSKIVALVNWFNTLLIFRDRDIWAFVGTSVNDAGAALILQTTAVGCVAPRSIADVPGLGLVFLGPDNLYALQGVNGIENRAQVQPIGDEIRKLLQRVMADGVAGVCATYYEREYWLCFPASLQDDHVFRYSLQLNTGWFTDTEPRPSVLLQHEGNLYGGLYKTQQIIAFTDSLFDGGQPIYMDAAFRRENLGAGPARIKRLLLYIPSKARIANEVLDWFAGPFDSQFGADASQAATVMAGTQQHIKVRLVVEGQQFEVKDFAVVAGYSQALSLQGLEPVQVIEARFHPSLQGHFVQVRLSGTVPGEDISFLGYSIEYEPRRTQRGKDV